VKIALLLQQLEDELCRGFNKRYTGHSPFLSFHKKLPVENPISRSDYFTLLNHDFPEYQSLSRLPQSRIWVREAIFADFRLRSGVLENGHFLIIESTSVNKQINFDIQISPKIQTQSTSKSIPLDNNNWRFDLNQPLVLWLIKSNTPQNLEELPKFFQSYLNREYERHPISHLNSEEWQLLREIDMLWAEIQDINEADIAKEEFLLWLQEIYIHFGWNAPLEDFYSSRSHSKKSNAFKHSERRWHSVRDKQVWKRDDKLSHYLNQYYSGSADLQQLQQFWVDIHFPAYRIKAVSAIADEPQKFIAFGLLAIQYRFVWAEHYFELLFIALPIEIHPLIRLLFLLKKQNSFFHFGYHWSYAASNELKSNQKLTHKSELMAFSQVHRKVKQITQINFSKNSYFSVDKAVCIRVGTESNKVAVQPLWMQPLDNLPHLNIVQIRYDFRELEIPLAWNQFQLECDKLHVKFLRKKNRFQVSISHIDPKKIFEIDEQAVQVKDSLDSKLYLPITKQNSKIEIQEYNAWGSKASEAQEIFFSGWVVDVFGTLHQRLNLSTGKGRGSRPIDLNSYFLAKTGKAQLGKSLTFSGRFLTKREIQLDLLNGPLSAFLYSPVELLRYRTIVFTEKSNKSIGEIFFEELGFYPTIRKISDLKNTLSGFAFLVSDSFLDHQVSSEEPIKVISLKNQSNKKGFLVHPQSLRAVLASCLQPK